MLRVAVDSDKGHVAEHFGHCEAFVLFDTQEGTILEERTLPNPGHKPGFLPKFLREKGVEVIISGGMGASAAKLFEENKMAVVSGATGEVKEVVQSYLRGDLFSAGKLCPAHGEG